MQGGLNYQKILKHFSGLDSGYAIKWIEMDNNIGFLDVYMGKYCPLNIRITRISVCQAMCDGDS